MSWDDLSHTKDATQPVHYHAPGGEVARVLCIEPEEEDGLQVKQALNRMGFDCESANSLERGYALFPIFKPEVLIASAAQGAAPQGGLQVLSWVQERYPDVPVIITAKTPDLDVVVEAFKNGAADFAAKPYVFPRLAHAVRMAQERALLRRQLREQQQRMDSAVAERTRDLVWTISELRASHEELRRAQLNTLERLVRASQWHDDETGKHIRRIGAGSALLARVMGMPSSFIEHIYSASMMHDIGKIGIADEILRKPGPLTVEERDRMKEHTVIGSRILGGSETPLLQMAERIAVSHHEWWDGTGYPYGLRGDQIPIEAQIVSVVDVFDALSHERCYKAAYPARDALELMRPQRGKQFSPVVFDEFLTCWEAIARLDETGELNKASQRAAMARRPPLNAAEAAMDAAVAAGFGIPAASGRLPAAPTSEAGPLARHKALDPAHRAPPVAGQKVAAPATESHERNPSDTQPGTPDFIAPVRPTTLTGLLGISTPVLAGSTSHPARRATDFKSEPSTEPATDPLGNDGGKSGTPKVTSPASSAASAAQAPPPPVFSASEPTMIDTTPPAPRKLRPDETDPAH